MSSRRTAVLLGSLLWAGITVLYVVSLVGRDRQDTGRALTYNLPIAFIFLVLLSALAIEAVRLRVPEFVARYGWTLLVWAVGFAILYLRLISKSLEVSGHLAWLPLLTAQAWVWRFPYWVSAVRVGALLSASYLKFAVFKGPSGVPGLAVGAALMVAFLVGEARVRSGAGEQPDAADEARLE